MITQSPTPAATRLGRSVVRVPRVRSILALVVLSFAIFAASAQAHTVSVTATCNTVTFHWTNFASSGNGNGGLNEPRWTIVFTPTGGGTVTTTGGHVTFGGSSFTKTFPLPGRSGSVIASSAWTKYETRDYNANSYSKYLTIPNCPSPPASAASATPAASDARDARALVRGL
jgi:hypothetical protein